MTGTYQIDTEKYKVNENSSVIAQFGQNAYSTNLISYSLSADINEITGLVGLTLCDKNAGFTEGLTSTAGLKIFVINK